MKSATLLISGVLLPSLALQSCVGNLADDSFAHAIKSGNARMAVANIQPGQATLHITERDGRTYYPIQYALCRGDAETTFALIRNGSPTRLDGRSLAYNAARVKQTGLAERLASAGYGTNGDIASAKAENEQQARSSRQAIAVGAAIGVIALMALASSGSSSSSGREDEEQQRSDDDNFTNHAIQRNRESYQRGEPEPYPSYPGYNP